jgi:hypothetical protein
MSKTPKKTLLLTIDPGPNTAEWMIKAMSMQIADWFKANQTILPAENLVLFPTKGETRLYWLEGDSDDVKDKETLDEIKDRIKPVLEVALGMAAPDKKFKHPKATPDQGKFKRAAEELNRRRAAKSKGPRIIKP